MLVECTEAYHPAKAKLESQVSLCKQNSVHSHLLWHALDRAGCMIFVWF